MKITKSYFVKLSVLLMLLAPAVPAVVYAGSGAPCGDNCSSNGGPSGNVTAATADANCADTTTKGEVDSTKVGKCLDQSKVVQDIQKIVNFLSAAVGVIIIIMIIVGGIQYSMAGDNSSATEAAKKRITNAIVALFAFMFAWAFLQWLIPGGIFGP